MILSMPGLRRTTAFAGMVLLFSAVAGCGQPETAGAAGSDRAARRASSQPDVATAAAHGVLTCPEEKNSGILDYFADTPAESWQDQAARYFKTTLNMAHPDATGPQITDQTTESLEVGYFGPTKQRVARLWFRAYKGGWRLEATEECASSPPSAEAAH
jgi:hypothetical protein